MTLHYGDIRERDMLKIDLGRINSEIRSLVEALNDPLLLPSQGVARYTPDSGRSQGHGDPTHRAAMEHGSEEERLRQNLRQLRLDKSDRERELAQVTARIERVTVVLAGLDAVGRRILEATYRDGYSAARVGELADVSLTHTGVRERIKRLDGVLVPQLSAALCAMQLERASGH
jgi:hypothetical protein